MAFAQGGTRRENIIDEKYVMAALQKEAATLIESKGGGDIGIASGSVHAHLTAGVAAFFQKLGFQRDGEFL